MYKICKRQVDEDRQCYVQVKKYAVKDRKKKKALQLYIYLDFECTQENGIHVPNLCMAHRVCQHCDFFPVDEPCTHCEVLGPRRHIFRGPQALKEFMDWLFQLSKLPTISRVTTANLF